MRDSFAFHVYQNDNGGYDAIVAFPFKADTWTEMNVPMPRGQYRAVVLVSGQMAKVFVDQIYITKPESNDTGNITTSRDGSDFQSY